MTISEISQKRFDKVKKLSDKIVNRYTEEERREMQYVLSLNNSLIKSVLDSIASGELEEFTTRVRAAYSQILASQISFQSKIPLVTEIGLRAWQRRREFSFEEGEITTLDVFLPNDARKSRITRHVYLEEKDIV